jgi:hypothetical protein
LCFLHELFSPGTHQFEVVWRAGADQSKYRAGCEYSRGSFPDAPPLLPAHDSRIMRKMRTPPSFNDPRLPPEHSATREADDSLRIEVQKIGASVT